MSDNNNSIENKSKKGNTEALKKWREERDKLEAEHPELKEQRLAEQKAKAAETRAKNKAKKEALLAKEANGGAGTEEKPEKPKKTRKPKTELATIKEEEVVVDNTVKETVVETKTQEVVEETTKEVAVTETKPKRGKKTSTK